MSNQSVFSYCDTCFWCSLFILRMLRCGGGADSHFPLRATIWAITRFGLHRHLLIDGLVICTPLSRLFFFESASVFLPTLLGKCFKNMPLSLIVATFVLLSSWGHLLNCFLVVVFSEHYNKLGASFLSCFLLVTRAWSNEYWKCFVQVMSVKALGIAMKLTLQGQNQFIYPQTSVFAMIVLICVLTQMNYLNKVLKPGVWINKVTRMVQALRGVIFLSTVFVFFSWCCSFLF